MTICEPQSGGDILCIRLSGLGDVVHCLNALSLLREHRPLAHITWIVEEQFAGILEGHPYINELMTVPRRFWGRSLTSPFRWTEVMPELMELALGLRRQHFDVSIDFQSSLKSAWLVAAAGARLRVGFGPPVSREFSHLVQSNPVSVPKNGCHRIERDLALLAPLGIPPRFEEAVLPFSRTAAEAAHAACAGLPRPLVIMHPGTSEFAAFKRWLPESYAEVAKRLMDERGAGVLVTYGSGEEALALRLVGATGHRAAFAPRMPHLHQFAHLLSQADLFIGSDTGPMHIASALKVPVVALFGPKDAIGTGPYCSRSEVVTAPVDCRPCTRRKCDTPRCMSSITVEQVLAAARRVLDGGGQLRAGPDLIRKQCYARFKLGAWRGEIGACYSAPEFYRLLAELCAAPINRDAAPVPRGWDLRTTGTAGGETRPLLARRRSRGGAAAWVLGYYWRSLLRLRRAGLPVRSPVCYMASDSTGEQLLVVEDTPGAVELPAALGATSDPAALGRAAESVGAMLQRFHRAGFHHAGLRAENILLDESHTPACLEGLASVWRVPWTPPLVRELAWGRQLRRLLHDLKGTLPEEDLERMLSAYCDGLVEGAARLRVLRWAIGRR